MSVVIELCFVVLMLPSSTIFFITAPQAWYYLVIYYECYKTLKDCVVKIFDEKTY